MNTIDLIIILSFIIIYYIINCCTKSKRPFAKTILYLATGPLVLFIMFLIGNYFQVIIPISKFSILFTMILGLPGVTTILLLNLFF